jgi:hypothetical protein
MRVKLICSDETLRSISLPFPSALFFILLFIASSGRMVLDAVHEQVSVFKVDKVLYVTDFMHLYRDGKTACSPQKGEMS